MFGRKNKELEALKEIAQSLKNLDSNANVREVKSTQQILAAIDGIPRVTSPGTAIVPYASPGTAQTAADDKGEEDVYDELIQKAVADPKKAPEFLASANAVRQLIQKKRYARAARLRELNDPGYNRRGRAQAVEEEEDEEEGSTESAREVTIENYKDKGSELFDGIKKAFNLPDKVFGFDIGRAIQTGLTSEETAKYMKENPDALKTLDNLYRGFKGQIAPALQGQQQQAASQNENVNLSVG